MGNSASSEVKKEDENGEEKHDNDWFGQCCASRKPANRDVKKPSREPIHTSPLPLPGLLPVQLPVAGISTADTNPNVKADLEAELDGSDIKKILKSSQPSRAVRAAAPATPASRADVTVPDSLLQLASKGKEAQSSPQESEREDSQRKGEWEKKEAGVGLLFIRGPDDKGWAVKTAIKGSPAEACGQIEEGDLLLSVDEISVNMVCSLGELSKRLMGTEGVPIKLEFSRMGQTKSVTLIRSNAFLGADGKKIESKEASRAREGVRGPYGTWTATRADFVKPDLVPERQSVHSVSAGVPDSVDL